MRRRAGFTLIELLVVIAIIAILAAILFPVFARAREKARQTSCLNNVKQLMLSVMMYAQDYDEILIPGAIPYGPSGWVNWTTVLEPYLKNGQILVCPSRATGSYWYGWNYREFGYYFADHGTGWCTPLAQVTSPAETILLGDNSDASGYVDRYLYKRNVTAMTRRHNDGGNMGLLDGHAKWYPYSELVKSQTGVAAPWRYAP